MFRLATALLLSSPAQPALAQDVSGSAERLPLPIIVAAPPGPGVLLTWTSGTQDWLRLTGSARSGLFTESLSVWSWPQSGTPLALSTSGEIRIAKARLNPFVLSARTDLTFVPSLSADIADRWAASESVVFGWKVPDSGQNRLAGIAPVLWLSPGVRLRHGVGVNASAGTGTELLLQGGLSLTTFKPDIVSGVGFDVSYGRTSHLGGAASRTTGRWTAGIHKYFD